MGHALSVAVLHQNTSFGSSVMSEETIKQRAAEDIERAKKEMAHVQKQSDLLEATIGLRPLPSLYRLLPSSLRILIE